MRDRTRDEVAKSAELLLIRFGFTAAAREPVRVRPVGPILHYEELDAILRRVVSERVNQYVPEVVFDFGTVEWIEAPWTAVVARFIDFARRSQARCRLAALHGQPAAVLGFFRDDRVIRSLLRIDGAVPDSVDARVERATA